MNVNMNVSNKTTFKNLDIVNASSKTEQFKKVLDNHEFRFRNLTNENTQKKSASNENTTTGIEKAIAYGNTEINLNDYEETNELKAEIIKFIEISIDAIKQNPVNLDGELRAELISFIQTAVNNLKQTPENLSKDSAKIDENNVSVVQIQQLLQPLSSIFKTQENVSGAESKENNFNTLDLEKFLDENLIGVENLKPETKAKLKNNLSKIFKLIGKSDTNKDESLQIQNVLQSLNFMFETKSDFKSVDLEKMIHENLIGVENLTPDVKNTLKNNLAKIFALIDKSDANKVEVLPIQNVLEKLIAEVSGVKGELDTSYLKRSKDNRSLRAEIINFVQTVTDALNSKPDNKINASKPQIQQILQSLKSIFETKQTNIENQESYLKPVDLEKMLDENLIGVENLTPEAKDILKDNLIKIFTLTEKSDSTASKPEIQKVLQSLSLMFENKESKLKPVDLDKMLDKSLIGVENITPETKNMLKVNLSNVFELIGKSDTNTYEPLPIQDVLENLIVEVSQVKGDLSLLTKDNNNVQADQIQQILQSLSSLFKSANSESGTENQQMDVSSINLEQLIGVENLTPETKNMLKRSFSEITVLVEKLETSVEGPSKILKVLQKLTTEVHVVKGDLSLLKIHSTQNVMINSEVKPLKDNRNSSFEEKFLGNLISGDKDEMKISKTVNFMNQFQDNKTLSTGKVETPNFVVDKNNFTVDVIKSMKFMEANNIKNLTVTMSPKELGEITIKLTVESGIMKAFISAQNKETVNLLSSNMQDISDKLKNMDIKIQSIDINIYEDSTFFSKESNKKNSNQKQTNDSKANLGLEEKEDVLTRDNYAIEQNAVNKFV